MKLTLLVKKITSSAAEKSSVFISFRKVFKSIILHLLLCYKFVVECDI
jgi:hypothetical protein